ncbi:MULTISPECIES: branched-chain amino acid ABC transporter permease [Paraburkholderia]|uniref:Branched-chain amino acid ABC transporter permease n=1 Tax=Paraburkholderia podalyriae TaxID=1938811 RepID=A0ABR7PTH4_9BURK|nr:branched-chain amino acid ABC transporter permease [Paraburkholderia podalyriae]MBC8749558.1 branched-chain amino acid ABC transporter permease [Paraburkholderia podalyriae]
MKHAINTSGNTSNGPSIRHAFSHRRIGLFEALFVVAALATYVFADTYLALATSVLIMAVFALSLDLAQGYTGIETLGHAAFFGSGAYAAGLFAMHVGQDAFVGLAIGAVAGAVVGLVTGIAVLRVSGLTQIMLTLTCSTLLYELGNVAKAFTMGDDGLTGYTIAPLFGRLTFDIYGHTAYVYAFCVLVLVYLFARYLVNSPLGLTAQGIRDNPVRMALLGVRVGTRRLVMYTIAAAIAGIAGALSAQVNNIVALDTLGFTLSANVLVMVALGGPGRLYGAILGAAVFVVLSDRAAAIDPVNWLAALGVVLILVVRFAPDGLVARFATRRRERRPAAAAKEVA